MEACGEESGSGGEIVVEVCGKENGSGVVCGACIHLQQPCKLFKEVHARVGRNWCVGFVGNMRNRIDWVVNTYLHCVH